LAIKRALQRHLPSSAFLLLKKFYYLAPTRFKRELRHEHAIRKEFLWSAFTALKFNGITGDYVEFGCCGANTFCMAYKIATSSRLHGSFGPIHFWAFDSFQGFPARSGEADEHPLWNQGDMSFPLDQFHEICRFRGVPRDAYTVVPGYYNESLTRSGEPRPEKIGLAYIDCDMYSSTKDVLQFLMPRLQHGMILAFDDYFCYSSDRISGERLAATEVFANDPTWKLYPYIQFGWHGMSFIVEHKREPSLNGESGW
jgi:O-methyltransferase